MKTCKVNPSASECHMCMDTADALDGMPNCRLCREYAKRYELIEIVSGIFNDYAFVQSNGKISKVSLDRIYDIKEEENNV